MLDIEALVVRYGAREPVLHGVTLSVAEAGVVALLGANGAGKTTLMRAVSGTLALHGGAVAGGSIRFQGTPLAGANPAVVVGRGLVQVPEGRHVFGSLTVEENLEAGAITVRNREARARGRARAFEMFPRLAERRKQRAGTLSGGEQQMLAIARALMSRPKLLLVEQNAAMALSVAHRAYVLELGRVVLEGPADELSHSDDVRRLYLGEESHGAPAAPARPVPALTRWGA
jgi:branched-chain amino acid transport system ATP-binding protein